MKLNLLKGATEIKLKSATERRIYEYLDTFKVRPFKREEKLNLSTSDMELRFFTEKSEIKRGIREGFVVSVDCFNRYFICFSRKDLSMYLLRIQFDLDEMFGRDVADLMDVREEKISGVSIGMEEAETLIDNYLEWMMERGKGEEAGGPQEGAKSGKVRGDIEDKELESWFER